VRYWNNDVCNDFGGLEDILVKLVEREIPSPVASLVSATLSTRGEGEDAGHTMIPRAFIV